MRGPWLLDFTNLFTTPGLVEGSEVVAINGESCDGMTYEDGLQKARDGFSQGTLNLELARMKAPCEKYRGHIFCRLTDGTL